MSSIFAPGSNELVKDFWLWLVRPVAAYGRPSSTRPLGRVLLTARLDAMVHELNATKACGEQPW